ncbi:superoxide dismutase [Sesbania bispinosa]|nr:superoxide dismutase [Sesbania bispinosa]
MFEEIQSSKFEEKKSEFKLGWTTRFQTAEAWEQSLNACKLDSSITPQKRTKTRGSKTTMTFLPICKKPPGEDAPKENAKPLRTGPTPDFDIAGMLWNLINSGNAFISRRNGKIPVLGGNPGNGINFQR